MTPEELATHVWKAKAAPSTHQIVAVYEPTPNDFSYVTVVLKDPNDNDIIVAKLKDHPRELYHTGYTHSAYDVIYRRDSLTCMSRLCFSGFVDCLGSDGRLIATAEVWRGHEDSVRDGKIDLIWRIA